MSLSSSPAGGGGVCICGGNRGGRTIKARKEVSERCCRDDVRRGWEGQHAAEDRTNRLANGCAFTFPRRVG